MASTALKKRGINPNRLTDKQRMFVLNYLENGNNGTKAAIDAGYSKKTAQVKASQLLADKKISSLVGKIQKQDVEELKLDRQETLRQLYYALTRQVKDFVDEDGKALLPSQLPDHVQSIVDGFKQTVKVDKYGNPTDVIMEYRLTPHANARDQAMKHKGLFELDNEQKADKVNFNFDALIGKDHREYDPIEGEIIEIENEAK